MNSLWRRFHAHFLLETMNHHHRHLVFSRQITAKNMSLYHTCRRTSNLPVPQALELHPWLTAMSNMSNSLEELAEPGEIEESLYRKICFFAKILNVEYADGIGSCDSLSSSVPLYDPSQASTIHPSGLCCLFCKVHLVDAISIYPCPSRIGSMLQTPGSSVMMIRESFARYIDGAEFGSP